MNNDGILVSVKKMLGIEPDVNVFDDTLLAHINTVISVLGQLGVGPEGGLYVGDKSTWADLIGEDNRLLMAKTYVQTKVRMLFDPPSSSAAMDAADRFLKEMEWRILAVTDYNAGNKGGITEDDK